MSGFTPSVSFATDFDGDHITMDLHRLKKWAFMKVSPHISGEEGADGKITMSFEDQIQLVNMLDEILPSHVSNFKGLKTADDNEVTLEEAIKEGYFISLTSTILGELFSISNPTMGEEGNPKDDGEMGNSTERPLEEQTV